MKAAFVLLLAICAIESRKIVPINKNANIDFINMESGGVRPNNVPVRPTPAVPAPAPAKPHSPVPSHPEPKAPAPAPKSPVPALTTTKPVQVATLPTPAPAPIKPVQPRPAQPISNQMDLKPVPPKSGPTAGVTTPGYGNVKQLVNFYDAQGKASVIRPYSYSQAVKQG